MIKIIYTPPNELDISGSVSEMTNIKNNLLSFSEESSTEYTIKADKDIDPSPYEKALKSLKVHVTSGPTKISVANEQVIVEGSRSSFEVFASYFNFSEGDLPGSHNHHEYFKGDDYIHPDSVPAVIGIK